MTTQPMTRRMRLGVVGVGTLSQRMMLHLVLPDAGALVDVVHLCDPVPGRAQGVADQFGVPRASLSLDDLLADDQVDGVTIASPIGLHYEQGLAAVRAGKHVHFNKTITVTTEEASRIIDEAHSHDVRLVASPGEMIRPQNQRVKELIQEGAIGRLSWAACGAALGSYHEDEPERRSGDPSGDIDPSWYFRRPGGGPMYDMTVYALHAMTGILGSVQRVTAMSAVRMPERRFGDQVITTEADDNTLLLLDFGAGLFAFAYGTAAGILTEGVSWDIKGRYFGSDGSIVGLKMNGKPFDFPGRTLAEQGSAPYFGEDWILPHLGPDHQGLLEGHVFEDVMQLVRWVRLGTPSLATAEHARHVVEIIEAGFRASATGVTQELTTTVEGIR